MFGLSLTEIVVVAVVALLVLGPERIPGVARSLGKILADLRRAVDEVKFEFNLHDITRPSPPPVQRLGGLFAEPPRVLNHVEHSPAPEAESVSSLNCEEVAKESPLPSATNSSNASNENSIGIEVAKPDDR